MLPETATTSPFGSVVRVGYHRAYAIQEIGCQLLPSKIPAYFTPVTPPRRSLWPPAQIRRPSARKVWPPHQVSQSGRLHVLSCFTVNSPLTGSHRLGSYRWPVMRNLPSMSWDKCTAITGVEPGRSQLPTDASGLSEAVKLALMAVVTLMVRVQVPAPAAAHAPPHWSKVPTV